jgi:hypothetical protein
MGPQVSPVIIWAAAIFAALTILGILIGFNLALGTRRQLGLYFIWISAALLVSGATAAVLILTQT